MASESGLYVGTEPITFEYDGGQVFIGPATIVREGHAIMTGREQWFTPLVVHYDVAQNPEAPQQAPAARESAEKSAARTR